jgi:hypothetical protein
MLNNLTNFFNLIAGRKIKTSTTIVDTDLITLGTRDPNYIGGYQPTAISYGEFVNSLSAVGVQSVTGLDTDNTDPLNPVVELAIDNTTLAGQGTLLDPLRAIQTETAQVVLFANLATTEVLKACTYNNGTLGVGATLTGNANGQLSTISFTGQIDNTTTALGQIILVKNQASQLQNGLYEVTQLGSVSTPFILTRTTDADTQAELYPIQINVFNGAINANTAFLQKTVDPVIGTSPIVFQTTPIGITNTPVLHLDTVTSTVLPTCTYTAGTNATLPGIGAYLEATAVGALGTISGIALIVGMRILVKDQVNQAHNGTYNVAVSGSLTTRWRLVRVDAWGSNFVRLQREWKVNNSLSTKFGARYSTNLNSLANTAVGTTALVFNEVPTSGLPAWVETDATDLTLWCNGKGNLSENTTFGQFSLKSLTGGIYNTAVGRNSLSLSVVGNQNTAIGSDALYNNTSAGNNTAVGSSALSGNVSGVENIAIGVIALSNGATGSKNIGIGNTALTLNTANDNVAVGHSTLSNNTTGTTNTAIGNEALYLNTTGTSNTAIGRGVLRSNTTASDNTGVGLNALFNNTTASNNTAIGASALQANTTGNSCTALGFYALLTNTTGFANTSIGSQSLQLNTTGQSNVVVGQNGLSGNTTGSFNIAIGSSTNSGNFSGSVIIGTGATATASNQFVVGSSGNNAGSVTSEINTSTNVWNVIINGVARKILLA